MRCYLRSRRMKINSTMNDMAKKLDISESYYSLIENGDRQADMSLSIMEKLAKAFEVSVQTIVKEEMKYKKGIDRITQERSKAK